MSRITGSLASVMTETGTAHHGIDVLVLQRFEMLRLLQIAEMDAEVRAVAEPDAKSLAKYADRLLDRCMARLPMPIRAQAPVFAE